jgi:hypothetical protein
LIEGNLEMANAILAMFFALLASLAAMMNAPGVWDIFDIAGIVHATASAIFTCQAIKAWREI